MKIMKKISVILLSLCLCMPCFSMVAHAADGRISFTDPETAVGEMVEVKCVVRSTSGEMSDVEVVLNYDTDALRFNSGANVTDDGNGSLTCTSTSASSEITFTIEFQALAEGDTSVSVSSATIADANGLALTLDQGSSAVKIAEGDPSKITEGASTTSADDVTVDVNGVTYTLTDNFADTDIPSGYTRTQVALDGQDRQMVTNDSNSIFLGYLKDADGIGDFFLFNEEDATFAVYEEISISDSASIIVLSDTSKVNLPAEYQEAKLTLNDIVFPVWQDTENEGFYVLYAMNNNGEEGYYRYDATENTYQRFEPAAVEEEEETDTSSLLGKIQSFVEDHLALVVLVGGLGAIILILILIILSVKLHNRNAELDELYDEYGIDAEEEPAPAVKKDKKADKKAARGKKKEEIFEEDDFEEEFEEDDFEEEEYEDEYEEDDFEEDEYEEEVEFEEEVGFEEDVFAGYETRSELTIDDLDALLGEPEQKKRGHMETDDTFKVDFIDLD